MHIRLHTLRPIVHCTHTHNAQHRGIGANRYTVQPCNDRRTLLYVLIGLAAAALFVVWLALFFSVVSWRPLWFALLLAPPGALARFYISLHNARFPKFPLCTFLINISGALLYDGVRKNSRFRGRDSVCVVCCVYVVCVSVCECACECVSVSVSGICVVSCVVCCVYAPVAGCLTLPSSL